MTKLFKIIETLLLGVFFGFVPIYLCLIVAIFITSFLPGKDALGPQVLWSLVPAVLIDIIFLKKWVRNAYHINSIILAIIYIFYSIIAIGMFMGIPLGVMILGIAAGLYIARKMQSVRDIKIQKQAFKKTASFCAAVMVLICCLITLWAIAGKMIGYKLETPFRTVTLTVPVFTAIVLSGSAVLVTFQYFLTCFTAKFMIKHLPANHNPTRQDGMKL